MDKSNDFPISHRARKANCPRREPVIGDVGDVRDQGLERDGERVTAIGEDKELGLATKYDTPLQA